MVQELLGHAGIVLIADTYTSVLPELARSSAEAMAALVRAAVWLPAGPGRPSPAAPARGRVAVRAFAGRDRPQAAPLGPSNAEPTFKHAYKCRSTRVRREGLEPPTRGLRVRCSAS